MTDLTLYHIAPSRSSIALWMLEEIGQPYEVRLLSMSQGENRQPAYLAVNPMGKVPALEHRRVIITETAAICCYLADAFPDAGLSVPVGDPRRGPYLKWLFFGPSCLEPAMIVESLKLDAPPPRARLGWGDLESVVEVISETLAHRPYLLGDQFTAADIVVGSGVRFGLKIMKVLPERPVLVDYVARLGERPAARRAQAKDAELAAR
jgi:glutathione S-transferase